MDQTVDVARRFGNFISTARARKRMTQMELSERTGVSQAHLSKIEAGLREPALSIALSLCNALEVDINDFYENYL